MGRLRTLRSGLLIVLLSVNSTSCAFIPDPTFSALQDVLTVQLVEATRTPSTTLVDFKFELVNHGRTMAEACVGPLLRLSFNESSLEAMSASLEGQECARDFHIAPGRKMLWNELLNLPDLPLGQVAVGFTIQITNPGRCSTWGCAGFDLTSNEIQVPST